ncbi:unnamed protein product [Chilo suppressalis]|uniref:Peptidase M16 N-terminal domain-containing protein n=1 Tax=Chilo suppressalis TaxID=168631 RepID=A0ABN8AUC7_CHISP|nr:unnamed protein product [Chilo suppressalis]
MLLSKIYVPVQKGLFTRCFSLSRGNQNHSWPIPDYGPMEVMRSDLMNGCKVASAKSLGAQIAACTIMYQAGSRYESDATIGASHFVRAMSSASGCGHSSYIKHRRLQQSGGFLTCTADRQSVAFTLRCPVTTFPDLKSYLLDTAARCCYHQWELDDCKSLVEDDLTRITPEQMVMDLIQKASFNGPLANSVFCPKERIDGMSKESMLTFVNSNFKPVRCTVGSTGVRFEDALKMAEMIDLNRVRQADPCTARSNPKSGYEYHDLGPGRDTWIALAIPGCGSCDLACLLKHAIIAEACGTGAVATGQHREDRAPHGPLGTMAGGDVYTEYRAFNVSYFDIGIFGIVAKTRACTAKQVARNAAEFLSNVGDLNFQQIATGKKRLKLSLAINDGDSVKVSEGLALQIANGLQFDSAKNSMALVDLIPPDEVVATARTLSSKSSAMSMAVVGDIGAVPMGTELL